MVNIDLINLGTGANTGDGDSLRVGAAKINQNFSNVLEFLESLEEDTNEDRLSNVFHVSIDGIAGNVGTSVADSVPSVKEAVGLANAYVAANPSQSALVVIHPGQYTEQNPITVKRNISIYGKGLRVVDLVPQNPFESFFLVDSGFKAWGLSIIGMQADSTRQAWCFEFDANADNTGIGASGTGAYILKSPYIQNCSSYTAEDDAGQAGSTSTGSSGGGLKVDGNACAPNSPIRSMVVDSFTQVNLGGPGCLVTNDGYAQLVSFFGTFCTYHCKADKGGQVNFTGGVSDFGDYGLVADGYSTTPIYTAKAHRDHYGVRRSELVFQSLGSNQLTYTTHGLLVNAPVTVKSSTNLPLPPTLSAGTVYYLRDVTANTVRLAATVGGTAITISTNSQYTNLITVTNQGELSVFCKDFTANRVGAESRPGNGVIMFPQLVFPRTGSLAANANSKGTVLLVEQNGTQYTAVATLDTAPASVGKHEYVPNTGTVTVTRVGIFVDPEGNTISTVPVAGLNTFTFTVTNIDYNHLTGYTTFTAVNYIPSALDEFYFTGCKFICQLSAYTVTSSEQINEFGAVVADSDNPYGYKVNLFNATNGGLIYPIDEDAELDFRRRSQISAPSHVFEYVGSGTNYNALPENGGVPNQANGYQEINNGRVFISWTNEKGDFGVSNRFLIDGTTGEVTISASSFNLSGLNQIGPFSRNGGLSTVGVAIKEASDNINMVSSLGVPDSQTVPTQTAVVDFVSQSLNSGIPNGAIIAGTAFYFTGSSPYPTTRIDSTPIKNGDILWDKSLKLWVQYDSSTSSWKATNFRLNNTDYQASTLKPTTRTSGSALVTGDRWYKTDDGTEWYWNGTYWLSTYEYATVDRAASNSTPDVASSVNVISYNSPVELVFVTYVWAYRIPGGLDLNTGDVSNHFVFRWGYHSTMNTSFADIVSRPSYLLPSPTHYREVVNTAFTITGFTMISVGTGHAPGHRMGLNYRKIAP